MYHAISRIQWVFFLNRKQILVESAGHLSGFVSLYLLSGTFGTGPGVMLDVLGARSGYYLGVQVKAYWEVERRVYIYDIYIYIYMYKYIYIYVYVCV